MTTDFWTTSPLLGAAAFAAGVLNAIAGGGSFLTLPALVFVGIPPIMANATSALAVSPGYLGSTLGFRDELRAVPARRLKREMAIAAAGGMAGALLLLVTPAKLFSGIVPWLLLFATVLFAFGPTLARRAASATSHAGQGLDRWREPGLLITCIYGGYFNGGLGILLMALYAVTGESRIHIANALKNLNSLVLSWLSVAAFVLAGAIAWREGVLMMVAATAGGFMGARWAKRLPAAWVRVGVIVTGVVMSLVFFIRSA
ncbi:sulfite exporter TauE/SafE family protein [Rhodoferax sp.]|uniref:sulfite exporter TauE/SafE family protein n=1 Tax=Rhodoferax sp. TaxID=50421 RepID=UPI002840D817|nr:sulfite exporter TauE/SafE family protein [Rhodoferax sp.]MDR3369832.1 sulfite exporter TauE/SafE family protein [Rhodoferax sp.]